MADRPILFSAPMVRAHLDLRKTQTRRLPTASNLLLDGHTIGRNPEVGKSNRWIFDALDWSQAWVDGGPSPNGNPGPYWHVPCTHPDAGETVHRLYPKWQPGDRLWVREAWAYFGSCDPGLIVTRADYPACVPRGYQNVPPEEEITWRPSIFMRRHASRLTDTVTEVRLQRLQDISEADAKAEGVIEYEPRELDPAEFAGVEGGDIYNNAVSAYRDLWGRINGPKSWATNPWVIATTFTVDERNIDA